MARSSGSFASLAAIAGAFLLLVVPAGARPAEAVKATASHASAHAADPVEEAVQELASADARVRHAARERLLHAELEELPAMAEAARALAPRDRALPELRQTLREVVQQVIHRRARQQFTASSDARFVPGRTLAFFGIQLAGVGGPAITVASSLSGFRAYEYFEEGDVILALRLDDSEGYDPVYNLMTLSDLLDRVDEEPLLDFNQSTVVDVLILRAGRTINIPFRLDVRIETNDTGYLRMRQQADMQARSVWETDFAPIFAGDQASS